MNASGGDSRDDDRIGMAAAEWVARKDRGLTAQEQDELSQWLADDPRHGEWLALQQRTWKDFNLLSDWRPMHSAEPNPDLLARPRRKRLGAPVLWLAAACLILGLITPLLLRFWEGRGERVASASGSEYERRVLEDGSILELNRGAVVEVAFTAEERRVHLRRGEAYFTVAKNPQRPFVVQAAQIGVRAVGTAFNVRLSPSSVEVLVTEGKVQVRPPDRHETTGRPDLAPSVPTLLAGQLAVVPLNDSASPKVVAVAPEDMARLLAWQPRLLEFDSTPLSAVVTEFNRRNKTKLVLGDPDLGAIPIVASFRSDSLDAFVRLLEISAGVRAERRGESEIVLRRAR